MFKKEYFLFFTVIGLAIAYGFFSILVFITRGKRGSLLTKKIAIGTMIIAFTAVLNTGTIAQTQEAPTPTPVYGTLEPALRYATVTPEPTPEPVPEYGVITPTPTETPIPNVLYGMPEIGDVNYDLKVNIVDALLIAQYYVGLNPPDFDKYFADVDKSTRIDIADALLVSQKYVGIIEEFPDNSPPEE